MKMEEDNKYIPLKQRLEMKYPNNKHPEFDRVEKELRVFNDTEEARRQDQIMREQIGK